jgi:hypothetical protein
MRTLALVLIAALLASPASAPGAQTVAYLAPRADAAVDGTGSGEAPSDVEAPIDLRRGVLGNEATDRGVPSPAGVPRDQRAK